MRWHENLRQHDEKKKNFISFSLSPPAPFNALLLFILWFCAIENDNRHNGIQLLRIYLMYTQRARKWNFLPIIYFLSLFCSFFASLFSRSLADITTHLHIGICMSERFFAMHARLTVGDKSFSVCSLNSCIIVNIDFLMNDFCRLFAFLCLSQKWNGRIWMEIMKIDTEHWRWWDNERGGGGSLKNRLLNFALAENDAQDIHEFKLRDKREKKWREWDFLSIPSIRWKFPKIISENQADIWYLKYEQEKLKFKHDKVKMRMRKIRVFPASKIPSCD